jgi:hypothetical protein
VINTLRKGTFALPAAAFVAGASVLTLWLDEIVSGSTTDVTQLARRERCTERQISLTLSLAFLAPPTRQSSG